MPITFVLVILFFFGVLLPDNETHAAQIYIAETFDRSFARSEAILWYNQETQVAYFHWVGID